MTEDFLYLEDGVVKVSEMAMQIPEFKDFRRYDTSLNKVFFSKAMSYIYYVYKVFGDEKSYLKNSPLQQRRQQAVRHHTGTYKNISDFENNEWVTKCIESYLTYSRTPNEIMFDTLKEDIMLYIESVQKIPHTIKKSIKVPYSVLDEDDPDGKRTIVKLFDVEIDIANTKERLEALKQASDLNDYYNKLQTEVNKDSKKKRTMTRMFEDKTQVSKIQISKEEFPTANR